MPPRERSSKDLLPVPVLLVGPQQGKDEGDSSWITHDEEEEERHKRTTSVNANDTLMFVFASNAHRKEPCVWLIVQLDSN